MSVVSILCGTAMVLSSVFAAGAFAQAQPPPPGPTYQAQLEQLQARIATEYQQLVDSDILVPVGPAPKDADAQLTAIVGEFRIMTNRWGMESGRAQQLAAKEARYMEALRQRDRIIKEREAELLTLRQRPPAVTPTPDAPRD